MAITHLLAPIPKWVIMNNVGTVAGGGYIRTFRSLNKTEKKAVYQDPGATAAWPNPIIFNLNGTQGPFYWTVDSDNPDETYYLEAFDAQNNPLWTVDNYIPPGTGGGGGNVTTFIPIVNYITNNQFIDHIDDTANPVGSTNLVIAPSNHKGFTPALNVPIVGTYGVVGPDIRFVKNNLNATDQITFPLFPLASYPLTGDVTPVDYIRYQCTNSPSDEQYKCFQFPISQKVKNLSTNSVTFGFWAAVTSTPATVEVFIRQYFGSGTAASPDFRQSITTFNLTTDWTWYPMGFNIPSVAGMSLGTPGQQTNDDASYIQIQMPLGVPCDIIFTKPALFLGNIDPELEFDSYDQIDSINSTPRTGEVRPGYLTSASLGWVPMNDGSIGNVGSTATTRANQDTFQLYKTIYDAVIDTWAPVSGGRTGSAVNDFIANKTLTLPRALGRALAEGGTGSGLTARALGEYLGEQTHTMTTAELAAHVHSLPVSISVTPGGTSVISSSTPFINNTGSTGSSTPFNVMQPTSFMNFYIKL